MKIKSYSVMGVIPVGSYANIQPKIELEDCTLEEANGIAMGHIKDMFAKHSDVVLKESDVTNAISTTIRMESFNERDIIIDFDKTNHKYSYNGTKLIGATSIVSEFTPKFDAEMIAKNCEKSWGIPAKDIVNLWESNKDIATDFGTIVHEALEHYFKNKAKGFDNEKSMPKHPILRSIIEDFNSLVVDNTNTIISEILVSDVKKGICGQIDRLLIIDNKKKICRVQDYKVNVSSEEISSSNKLLKPYNTLPANKLSKYQLQLNVYAQMLENSGWTVEGLDVYVYEDKWKHYELDRIKI